MFFDEALRQFLDRGRAAGGLAGVEGIIPAINLADQALGFIPGRRDGPCWPDPDREALLLACDPVDQDEALAPGGVDAEPEAGGIFIEEDILATTDFGSLYNTF